MALLAPAPAEGMGELAEGLRALGHDARLVSPVPVGPVAAIERRLRRRGFLEHLTAAPRAYVELRRAGAQVAHLAHPALAPAAIRWSRLTGRPFVFQYSGTPDHADLMSHRKKLETVQSAARGAAAVVAATESGRTAFCRWLGAEARVIDPEAGPEPWVGLYREVLS